MPLPRMPFVLLVLVLLGGGLTCLLVINTTLGATSFRISNLQSTGATLATQEQALQQQIAAEQSPAQIAKRAYQLGMRTQVGTSILDLSTQRLYKLPGQASVVTSLGAGTAASPSRPAAAKPKVGSVSRVIGSRQQTHRPAHRSGSAR